MFDNIVSFIKKTYNEQEFIPLHEPKFIGNEKKYLNNCIDSTFVSSIGEYVDRFEKEFALKVNSKYAIAIVNGTSALHIALILAGVEEYDEVITQPLTFIATCNAIKYINATPIFVDVDIDTMGLSPNALEKFLKNNCYKKNNQCINKLTNKIVKACVPMHTFGMPCRIEEIKQVCDEWNIKLVEDAAESLGSYYNNKHTGTFGEVGVFSFNGNKIITAGGGGCIVTDSEELAQKAKHMTTTAKVPHKWEYTHDLVGYNYRMPNLNAALLVAQLESLDKFLMNKQELHNIYKSFFKNYNINLHTNIEKSKSNYWLNAIILKDREEREGFLKITNENGIMTRPIWTIMTKLDMYKNNQTSTLDNSQWLEDRVVNIPSSVRL